MGAIGVMGAMACLLVMLGFTPAPASLSGYALMRGAMGAVASWIFLPALALTLLAGLLSLAQRAFHNAGWACVKLATGVLMFEGGLVYIQGPMRQEADLSAAALGGVGDPALLGQSLAGEAGTLWVLLTVATANVVLGVWRPRLIRLPTRPSAEREPLR